MEYFSLLIIPYDYRLDLPYATVVHALSYELLGLCALSYRASTYTTTQT